MGLSQIFVICSSPFLCIMFDKFSIFEKIIIPAYLILVFLTSFTPAYRTLWLIENGIAFALLGTYLLIKYFGFNWSRMALIVIIIACCMQTIGGYYTFINVPYGGCLDFFGAADRNNFDRLGHFMCGMVAYPLTEYVIRKKIIPSKIYALFFIVLTLAGIGAIYELIEWGIVQIVEKSTGLTYIAKQGDEWDAQADMFCCTIGAIIGFLSFISVDAYYKRLRK